MLRIASRMTEVPDDDLELAEGMIRRKADATPLMPIKELAHRILVQAGSLPPDEEPGLDATAHYEPPPSTHANATHIALVEVDSDTRQGHPAALCCGWKTAARLSTPRS